MAKFQPFPFQIDAAKEIDRFKGRALLAIPMGGGKTAISCMWLKKRPKAMPAVVVCPASVKFGWERHVLEILKVPPTVLEGRKPLHPKQAKLIEHHVIIINYDIVANWLDYLIETGFKTLIIDEIQYCANRKTNRTKACKILAKHARHTIGSSGTPLVNRPAELFPGLNMIRPDIYKSFWSYAVSYCNPKRTPWGWNYNGSDNIPQLNSQLRSTCMIRKSKSEIMHDLPEKMRDIVVVPLENPKEYQHAQKDFMGWLRRKDPTKTASASKAQQLVRMGYLKRLAAQLKMRSAVEWINNWLESTEQEEKLVIFAVHKVIIARLEKECITNSIVIDGSVAPSKRKQLVRKFREDKRTRLCIGNIKAAGTGLDGLQVANSLAFVEMDWRPGDHSQAEDRIHRIGLKETAWIYYLIAAGTIEEDLCRLIQEKQEVISATLDGSRAPDDLDVFDKLVRLMKSKK